MSMAGKQQWKWEESTGEIAEKNQKARIFSAAIPNVNALLTKLNTVFVIVIGVYLINNFELTKGGLIAVMILSGRTIGPMGKAAALISTYADAKSAYKTLDTILGKEAERPEGEEFIRNESFQGRIEFKDVSFSYPNSEMQALTNISFVIEPKEKVAFIGKIGSGKSTIAKLILKLYEPTSGSILLDGIDIGQIDPADVRRYISYVPQDVALFKGTIKENIVSSEKHPDIADIIYATQVSGVDDFIQRHPLGFDMPIGERGAGLSGGQRQSVGVARALMKKSSIMLLDEPTNAMDQTTEKKLLNQLSIELKDETVLLITQKMSLLSMVDRVIVIHNSKLLIDDTKEVVIKKLGGNEKRVPSKAKAIKLDNPAQVKTNHQPETELHRLGGNKTSKALPKGCFLEIA
jgi:ATP-binding cassette subfamily C protein LapB